MNGSLLEIQELKRDKMPGAWEFIEAMVIGRAVRPNGVHSAITVASGNKGHGSHEAV